MKLFNPRDHLPVPQRAAPIRRIALIGNFLPRRCGLATFTTDSWRAIRDRYPDVAIDVYAMSETGSEHDYPEAVTMSIDDGDPAAYRAAARQIARSGADLIWLQHEFGIFGGEAGEMILQLLDRVSMPLMVTFHTVLEQPEAAQRRVMEALLRRATRVVVMAEKGRDILIRCFGARPAQVVVIKHGIPDRPLVEPEVMKKRLGLDGRDVILTFGLLSPDKGIETMIEALPAIIANAPRRVLYVILGATHPHLVAREGEAYRERLQALAARLGVAEHILWINAFVDQDELADYLAAADIYVTPYLNPAQITSGTLSYAVGLGKPVVSTPYVHACELLADDHGRLVDFRDSAGFAHEICALLGDDAARERLRQRAYALGRTMTWPCYAEEVMATCQCVRSTAPVRIGTARRALPPGVSLSGIERLTDRTGMYQHSLFSVPDLTHGYCLDDNARALLLMNRHPALGDEQHDRLAMTYAAFIQHAWNPERDCFRNFMAFDRRWLEDEGSEDSYGRALWVIGVTARDNRRDSLRHWAAHLFERVAPRALELRPLRAAAFALLGAKALLDAHPDDPVARQIVARGGEMLMDALMRHRCPDWVWFEPVLAYDNCRLPEALLLAARLCGDRKMEAAAFDTLEWIVARQTNEAGQFRAVGTDSFGRAYLAPEPFDQQPLEAWATIDACTEAHAHSRAAVWLDHALRAYRWYLGENDLGLAIANPTTGECMDGLMPAGLNRNQGAESVLAFQLASATMLPLLQGKRPEQELSLVPQ